MPIFGGCGPKFDPQWPTVTSKLGSERLSYCLSMGAFLGKMAMFRDRVCIPVIACQRPPLAFMPLLTNCSQQFPPSWLVHCVCECVCVSVCVCVCMCVCVFVRASWRLFMYGIVSYTPLLPIPLTQSQQPSEPWSLAKFFVSKADSLGHGWHESKKWVGRLQS